jgi:hypothetical protein
MSPRKKPYDEKNETEKAWFWVVVSHMGGGKSDLKEIARLLRLGQAIPKIAQNFIADLLDPPPGGGEDFKLVLKSTVRQRKLEKELGKFQKEIIPIVAAMSRGKGITAAIAEVMPGKERQGFRLAKPWIEILEQDPRLVGWFLETFPEPPPTITDKK